MFTTVVTTIIIIIINCVVAIDRAIVLTTTKPQIVTEYNDLNTAQDKAELSGELC